ncbi:MAG: type II toxin-antitoxin system VapC family toxin [Verrucomicrobiales bacterium]|nr:type II toxin-antitoxin system VapC family toxin [Verrucomicrobiales bacterium]
MPFLLDTNVLSELRKGEKCDSRVRRWAVSTKGDRHCLCVVSLGEIRKGIEILRRKAPDQCPTFERWLEVLKSDYSNDLLPVNEEIMNRWGILQAAQSLPVLDGLIAATALEHGLTVATRKVRDFEKTGVKLVNPFE